MGKNSFTLCLIFLSGVGISAAQDENEGRFLKNTRQLIYEGKRSGEGYFSADGDALIFQSEREPENPFFQIYFLDLETGDSHRISPGTGKTTCAFLRPGTNEVLFASTHLDPNAESKQNEEIELRTSGKSRRYSWDYDDQMDIFSAQRDGSGIKQLTKAKGYDAEGSYSPDGSKIVFCSLRYIYNSSNLSPEDLKRLKMDPAFYGEIYIMNSDGSDQTRLTHSPGYDGGPFFSPDGKRIVWRRFEENGAIADVYTMLSNGSDVRKITQFNAMSWAPYFHPSGKYLIFASNKLGFSNFELYMVDALGEYEPVRVTSTEGFDGLPVFSPDGDQLCWTSNRTSKKQSQLFLADWNHKAALTAIFSAPKRNMTSAIVSNKNNLVSKNVSLTNGKHDKSGLSAKISGDDIRAQVSFLASDKLEGRMSGTRGTKMAADYITSRFNEIGLKPLGDED